MMRKNEGGFRKRFDRPYKKQEGVVDFEDVNKIKKKNVRGLLRKRARKYECMQS